MHRAAAYSDSPRIARWEPDGGGRGDGLDEQRGRRPLEEDLSTAELAHQQRVQQVSSVDDLAQRDLWESDEEYEEFLADLYTSRRTDLA